jgi:addiction module HigA family antidote
MTTTLHTHPGIILRDEFFEPLGITQLAAAKATGIPQSRLSEILAGRRAITSDTAVRLGRFFKLDPRNFLNLQTAYDLAEAKAAFLRQKPRRRITPYNKLALAHA